MNKSELIYKWHDEFLENTEESLASFYKRTQEEAKAANMIMAAHFDDMKVNINYEGVTFSRFAEFFERVLIMDHERQVGNYKKGHGGRRPGAGNKRKPEGEKVVPVTIYVKPAHVDSFKMNASDVAADMNAGRTTKAENLWQTLNAVLMCLDKNQPVLTEEVRKCLRENRPVIGAHTPG